MAISDALRQFLVLVRDRYADDGAYWNARARGAVHQNDHLDVHRAAVAAGLEAHNDWGKTSALLAAVERGHGRLLPREERLLKQVVGDAPDWKTVVSFLRIDDFEPRFARAGRLIRHICAPLQAVAINSWPHPQSLGQPVMEAMQYQLGVGPLAHAERKNQEILTWFRSTDLYRSNTDLTRENLEPLVRDKC